MTREIGFSTRSEGVYRFASPPWSYYAEPGWLKLLRHDGLVEDGDILSTAAAGRMRDIVLTEVLLFPAGEIMKVWQLETPLMGEESLRR